MMPQRRLKVLIGTALAASACAGWLVGATPPAWDPATGAHLDAPLPSVQRYEPLADLARLAASDLWGGRVQKVLPAAVPAGAEAPQWRITGVVLTDDDKRAVILIGPPHAARAEFRRIGELLPDGSRITGIDADRVGVQRGAASAEIEFFRQKQ